MSVPDVRHVLALLDDDAAGAGRVLEQAVGLAQAAHARLTLAGTSDPGWLATYLCPAGAMVCGFPVGELGVNQEALEADAARRLARAAELVPAGISVTTVVLGRSTVKALRRLLRGGGYDVVVVTHRLLRRNRRLRRTLRRLSVPALTVPAARPAPSRRAVGGSLRPGRATPA